MKETQALMQSVGHREGVAESASNCNFSLHCPSLTHQLTLLLHLKLFDICSSLPVFFIAQHEAFCMVGFIHVLLNDPNMKKYKSDSK